MARIVYALTSQGRGHSSRVTAMAEELEARGHELLFCAGGGAGKLLTSQGREVVEVPVLRHRMRNNEIQLWTSLVMMAKVTLETRGVIGGLADRLAAWKPDLLITDFESYSIRAARKIGLPLMCFNHQQVLTHTRYSVPRRYAWDAWVARLVVDTAMPRSAAHVLISSFFYPPLRWPERTTLVAPILRGAVRAIAPTRGEHVLVYHNDPTGLVGLLEALGECRETRFIVYNFEAPADADKRLPNVVFKRPEVEGFLADLASARAVIATAGYTLTSEALWLGKPLLVLPNGGIFEQTLNAIMLEREGLGEAVMEGMPSGERIREFLERADRPRERRSDALRCGNEDAARCIERVLEQVVR
ncbi:glycosyltransferase family protein [Nannocystaceae bacterium ST9]